ncbi:hypothetical protein G6F38_013694 [Rhizopus arrhizus]|nr:hypothetical protein G6F38_013694 [Rhizopus arrhizus]
MVDNPFIPRNANQALIYQNDHLHHQHHLPNNHNIDLVDSNEHAMPALALNQVHYNNTLGTNQLVTMDTSRNRNHSRHVQVNGYYNNSENQQQDLIRLIQQTIRQELNNQQNHLQPNRNSRNNRYNNNNYNNNRIGEYGNYDNNGRYKNSNNNYNSNQRRSYDQPMNQDQRQPNNQSKN